MIAAVSCFLGFRRKTGHVACPPDSEIYTVARSSISDMRVMEGIRSLLEWMALGIEWAIKLVMWDVFLLWPYWQTFPAASLFCTKLT